jgi:hypothetical protein
MSWKVEVQCSRGSCTWYKHKVIFEYTCGRGKGKGEMEGGGIIADHLTMDPFPYSFLHESKAEVNHSNYYHSNLQNMQLSYDSHILHIYSLTTDQ